MADDFDLSELIAAPIKALNEAEASAAARFVELFLDFTTEEVADAAPTRTGSASPAAGGIVPAGSSSPRLRQLSFAMQRPDPDGQMRTYNLTVPLLQVFPFGGVSIEQATLNYGLTLEANRETARTAVGEASRFSGRLAQTRGSRDATGSLSDANLEIEVKLRQIDIPQGLLDLIQHTQGIVRSEVPLEEPPPPPPISDPGLFRVEVLRLSRGRQRVPLVRLVLRVTPRPQLGSPLDLQFRENPERSFGIRVTKGIASIATAAEFELALSGFTSEKLAMLTAGRLGVAIAGTSTDRTSGARVDHEVLMMLAS